MRIRVLEAEKGGISVEKGGLAEQLARLDADFRALQQQLEDKRNELQKSIEREAQLKSLLDSLQVVPGLYVLS
jgi:predicted  nucleic acid-binding Zn-ribbon protein